MYRHSYLLLTLTFKGRICNDQQLIDIQVHHHSLQQGETATWLAFLVCTSLVSVSSPMYMWCAAFNRCRLRVNFGLLTHSSSLEPPTFSLVQLPLWQYGLKRMYIYVAIMQTIFKRVDYTRSPGFLGMVIHAQAVEYQAFFFFDKVAWVQG